MHYTLTHYPNQNMFEIVSIKEEEHSNNPFSRVINIFYSPQVLKYDDAEEIGKVLEIMLNENYRFSGMVFLDIEQTAKLIFSKLTNEEKSNLLSQKDSNVIENAIKNYLYEISGSTIGEYIIDLIKEEKRSRK